MSPENANRLRLLKSAPLNSWVALSEDETRIVAVGSTYEEAVKASEDAGATDPLLIKTPAQWRSFAV